MRATGTIVGVVVAVVGIGAAVAEAGKIYWTDSSNNSIKRANLDGTGDVVQLVSCGVNPPRAIALDLVNNKIYWSVMFNTQSPFQGAIYWADLDGGNAEPIITHVHVGLDIVLLGSVCGLAVDPQRQKLYWSDIGEVVYGSDGYIGEASLDGTSASPIITIEPGMDPRGLAVDPSSDRLYWAVLASQGDEGIQSATLEDPEEVVLTVNDARNGPGSVTLDLENGKIYWQVIYTVFPHYLVKRSNLDGTNIVGLVDGVGGGNSAGWGVALDLPAQKVYWTQAVGPVVRRANLDGTDAENGIFSGAQAIALDLRDDNPIPAVSTWGVAIMTLLVLTLGTVVIINQRRRQQTFV